MGYQEGVETPVGALVDRRGVSTLLVQNMCGESTDICCVGMRLESSKARRRQDTGQPVQVISSTSSRAMVGVMWGTVKLRCVFPRQ